VSVPADNTPRSSFSEARFLLTPGSLPAGVPPGDAPRRQKPSNQQIVARVRGEFLEMPGLSPTLAQAARLFALPATECQQVLGLLLNDGFLRCSPDGHYLLTARR
jgi:hypothetical protein